MTQTRMIIPEKIYVGIPKRVTGVLPLASLTAWGDDHAAKGRIQTVDSVTVDARAVANTPLHGYRLTSTNYKDEVIIEDPRGFGVYIKMQHLLDLLRETSTVDGMITGACVWARTNGQNTLLLLNSERYHRAIAMTELANSKLSWRTAKIGNRVSLSNGVKGIFLGKYAFLTFQNSGWVDQQKPLANRLRADNEVKFVLLDDRPTRHYNSQLYITNSPVLARIDNQEGIDPAQAELLINKYLHTPACHQVSTHWDYQKLMAVSRANDLQNVRLRVASTDFDPHSATHSRLLIDLPDGELGLVGNITRNQQASVFRINRQALSENKIVIEVANHLRTLHPITTSIDLSTVANFSKLLISVETSLGNVIEVL